MHTKCSATAIRDANTTWVAKTHSAALVSEALATFLTPSSAAAANAVQGLEQSVARMPCYALK
jgi:hypothetical protein